MWPAHWVSWFLKWIEIETTVRTLLEFRESLNMRCTTHENSRCLMRDHYPPARVGWTLGVILTTSNRVPLPARAWDGLKKMSAKVSQRVTRPVRARQAPQLAQQRLAPWLALVARLVLKG